MKKVIWNGKPAHIWLNEIPDWTYDVIKVLQRRLPATKRHTKTVQKLAIEMVIPGPKAHYGALAAVFLPDDTQHLQVEVSVSKDQGDIFVGSLAERIDKVQKGFPEEYATGFLDGIVHYDPLQTIGGGTLSFCGALHGEIGSSVGFFQAIGRLIINLLALQLSSLSDEDLKEVIQQTMKLWYRSSRS